MVTKVRDGKIILTWSWGGQLVLTLGGARQLVQILLGAISESESGLSAQKQL